MEIPQQLKNERFIIVNNEKRPIETGWTSIANYDYDEIKTKGITKYGVLCGNNNLMVIDCDNEKIQNKLLQIEKVTNTFTTQTAGKGLYHFYFHVTGVDTPKGFRADNEKGERIFDFQGKGTQVIGPGTVLDNGRDYKIVNPREIATIPYNMICEILKNVQDDVIIVGEDGKKKKALEYETDEVCRAIKEKIDIRDLLDHKENPGMCPLGHTSEGGQCFSYTDSVWNCFHCGQHGGLFQLHMKMNNCSFTTSKKALAEMAGLKDDYKIDVLTKYGDMKTRHEASESLAHELVKMHNIYTIRSDEKQEIWVYKEGIYVPEGKSYIKEFCREILGQLYKIGFVQQVIEKIMADTAINADDFFINENINKIPVLNGVLDLEKLELESFTPKYRFFNKIQIVYDPLIKPEKILDFFDSILIDEKDKRVIQELFGYLLLRDYKYQHAFMFLGTGRNGKGKTLNLMEMFIGKVNTCSIPLQKIGVDNFITSKLHNKLANLSGDLSDSDLKETGMFKQVTGEDTLTADRKFLTAIEFKNYAKMVFACNQLPYVNDTSPGFWERWILIDFPYQFIDNPIDKMDKKADKRILDTISTSKEMTGLLTWALEGLKRLRTNNKFSISTTNETMRKTWIRKASSFAAFLDDEIEYSGIDNIPVDNLNRAYTEYCREHKCVPESPQKRNPKLVEIGSNQSVKSNGGVLTKVWTGIKFKKDVVEEKFEVEEE